MSEDQKANVTNLANVKLAKLVKGLPEIDTTSIETIGGRKYLATRYDEGPIISLVAIRSPESS